MIVHDPEPQMFAAVWALQKQNPPEDTDNDHDHAKQEQNVHAVAGKLTADPADGTSTQKGDLMGTPKAGFSGANGMPYRAGDPNKRDVREYGRALAREKSEQAMYKDLERRERKQKEKDSAEFAEYYSANYAAIQARRELAKAKQKAEVERLKQAKRYHDMAMFASREAQAGGGAA